MATVEVEASPVVETSLTREAPIVTEAAPIEPAAAEPVKEEEDAVLGDEKPAEEAKVDEVAEPAEKPVAAEPVQKVEDVVAAEEKPAEEAKVDAPEVAEPADLTEKSTEEREKLVEEPEPVQEVEVAAEEAKVDAPEVAEPAAVITEATEEDEKLLE